MRRLPEAPCTLLDFPTEQRFVAEITRNQFDVVGISSIQTNLLKVRKMCRLVRKHLPDATIVVGGLAEKLPHPAHTVSAHDVIQVTL